MMLAIDVGIKNLAYCVANVDACAGDGVGGLRIQRWSVVNLVEHAHDAEPAPPACVACGKRAKASAACGWVCARHVPKDKPLLVDVATGEPLVRVRRAPLVAFLASRGLRTSGPLRALVERASALATLPCSPAKPPPRARDFAMNTNRLHDAIRDWVERDWDALRGVTSVYIEHQPVVKNPTMKTVQMLVYATLRERLLAACGGGGDVAFHFTHASTKVRGCASVGDAGYTTRKAFARARALHFLESASAHPDNRAWLPWLRQQKKTDDLTDALCMLLDATTPRRPPAPGTQRAADASSSAGDTRLDEKKG